MASFATQSHNVSSLYVDEFFITGCDGSCQHENSQCSKWMLHFNFKCTMIYRSSEFRSSELFPEIRLSSTGFGSRCHFTKGLWVGHRSFIKQLTYCLWIANDDQIRPLFCTFHTNWTGVTWASVWPYWVSGIKKMLYIHIYTHKISIVRS